MSNVDKHIRILTEALSLLKSYKATIPIIAAAKDDYPILHEKLKKSNETRLENYAIQLFLLKADTPGMLLSEGLEEINLN